MFKTFSTTLHTRANGRSILLLLALMVLFAALIVPFAQRKLLGYSHGVDLIDLMLTYTPDTVYSMLAAYGEDGRSFYRAFAMSADLVYPVVYSTFLGLITSWLLQRVAAPGGKAQLLNLLPFGAMLFDWLENAGVITMLSAYPTTLPTLARISSTFTSFKWGFSAVTLFVIVALSALAIRKKLARNSGRS